MRTKNQIYDDCMSGGITSLLFMNETSAELCRVYVCVRDREKERETSEIWYQKRSHRPCIMTSRRNGYKIVVICVVLVHNAYGNLGGYLSPINPTCPQGMLSLKAFASSKL